MALSKSYTDPAGVTHPDAYWYLVCTNASRLGRQVGVRLAAYASREARDNGMSWLLGSERDYRWNGDDAAALLAAADGGDTAFHGAIYAAVREALTPDEMELPEGSRPAPYFADAEDA
jgi:hypothetical protein